MTKTRSRKRRSGRIGSAARRSIRDEQRRAGRPPRRRATPGRRGPGQQVPAEVRHQHQCTERDRQGQGAEPVQVMPRARPGGRQRRREHPQRHCADRQIDVEDPAPGEVGGDESADQRTGDARRRESGAEHALVASPLPGRHDVGDRRLRTDDQPAAAEALDRTKDDELGEVTAQAAQRRAHQEDDDGRLEDALPPVEVAELAVERDDGGLGQEVRGHHPGQMGEPAELGDDGRERGGDDGPSSAARRRTMMRPARTAPRCPARVTRLTGLTSAVTRGR